MEAVLDLVIVKDELFLRLYSYGDDEYPSVQKEFHQQSFVDLKKHKDLEK